MSKFGGKASVLSKKMESMDQSTSRRPLRWRLADRLSGNRAGRAIVLSGTAVILAIMLLMLFRPYVGRPAIFNKQAQTLEQTPINCPRAWTSMFRSFNKADPSTPDHVRICVESAQAKAFTMFLLAVFLGVTTWGLFLLPQRGRTRKEGRSDWDDAIAKAKSRATE